MKAADSSKTSTVILMSELDDPALAERLWDFAEEAREVATRLGEELYGGGDAGTESLSTPPGEAGGEQADDCRHHPRSGC